MKSIETTIREIVAETASADISAVTPTATIQDLGIASLDAIEMLFQIEEKYDVEITDRDVDLRTATVTRLVEVVESRLALKAAPPAVMPAT